jgi:hypothetical protein
MMTGKQTTIFHFRCPPELRKAIEAEARREILTPSAYVRRVLARHSRGEGTFRLEAATTSRRATNDRARRSAESAGEAA